MAEDRDHLTHEFGLSLIGMSQRWRRVLDERLRPEGMTLATWRTLVSVSRAGGVMQKDLAAALGIEGPSLVRLLDALEGDGLTLRREAASDRRGKTVHLTEAGETCLNDVQGVQEAVRTQLLNNVSDEELRVCHDVFQRVWANAKVAGAQK